MLAGHVDDVSAKLNRLFVEGGKMAASETIDIWLDLDPIYQSILESESAKK